MKHIKLLIATVAGFLALGISTPTFAADKATGNQVTIQGEAKCAMCALKETDKCQTVIQTENKEGKKVTYYLADNDLAKEFHHKVCKAPQKVTATGTVKRVDGKQQLTLTKITTK